MKTIVLYHGKCPDGFGGAYAAWKKFGDSVEYASLERGSPIPEGLEGNEIYMIDFSYEQEDMDKIKAIAARFVVLDHHESVKEATESVPEHVYDANRSGASIAWSYFHPDTPLPALIKYLEDDDLFRFKLPETRALITYLTAHPYSFAFWDEVAQKLDSPAERQKLFEKANTYAEYFELLAQVAVKRAKLISFEGYTCYFATSHPLKPMQSLIGNLLAKKMPPIALVVSAHPNGYGVAIRGDGSVDVSAIAKKYNGGGHPSSSGFLIPREGPFPWTLLEKDENPRD